MYSSLIFAQFQPVKEVFADIPDMTDLNPVAMKRYVHWENEKH